MGKGTISFRTMHGSASSRGPLSRFASRGIALGHCVALIFQKTGGWKRHKKGGCAEGTIARFSSLGKFASTSRTSSEGGAHKATRRATISARRTKCSLGTWIPHAGQAKRCIRTHDRRVDRLARRQRRRHQFTNTGLAKAGWRALGRGCPIRTFTTCIRARTHSHAPAMLALNLNR